MLQNLSMQAIQAAIKKARHASFGAMVATVGTGFCSPRLGLGTSS
jgi:predicted RND superfamily exporter protein